MWLDGRRSLCNTCRSRGITEPANGGDGDAQGASDNPEAIRDRLGIKPGSKVDFEIAEDGRAYLRRLGKSAAKPSRFERMRGTATSGLTTDQIMASTRGEG